MNNDGHPDAVVVACGGSSRVFENDGHGNFSPVGVPFGSANPSGVAIADLDADGRLDVIIGDSATGARIWWNRGNHIFAASTSVLTSLPGSTPVSVSDLNGDSFPDLVVATQYHLLIFQNDGHGRFVQSNDLDSAGAAVNIADVDGDHDVDILSGGSNLAPGGELHVNDGHGNFAPGVPIAASLSHDSIADFNGDGLQDVFVANAPNILQDSRIFFNNGANQFVDSGQSLDRKSDGHLEKDSAVGDFDLDGDVDLFVIHDMASDEFGIPNPGETGSSLWWNDGTGHFTHETLPFFPASRTTVGDVDQDGDLDVVSTDGVNLQVAKNRTISEVTLPAGGGSVEVLQTGLDLVVRRQGGAEIFREPATGIKVLRVIGSTAADRVDASTLTGIKLVLNGRDGNDTLIGSAAADSLNGGGGDDSLVGNNGDDQLNGDAGNDWLFGNMGNDSLDGGDDADTLIGGNGQDQLRGGNGNDQLNGGSGNDRMFGDAGTDVLRGDAGNDLLDGGTEADTLVGDDGNDSLLGGVGDDLLRGVAGRDTLDGGAGNDDLRGGADNDALLGGLGNDTLNGNIGNDTLIGGDGDDALAGGTGHDQLLGNAGRDTLLGGSGNDSLYGGADADILLGEAGNDSLDGQGDSQDTLNGGAGTNTMLGLPTEIDLAFTFDPDWRDRS